MAGKFASARPVRASKVSKAAEVEEQIEEQEEAPKRPASRGKRAQVAEPEAAPAPKAKGKKTKAVEADTTTERADAGTGVDLDETLIPETEVYDRKVVAVPELAEKRETSIDGIYARLAKKPITLRNLIIAIDRDEVYRSVRRSQNPANLITRVRDAYSTYGVLVDAK